MTLRYKLRTLWILLAVLPALSGGLYHSAQAIAAARERARRAKCNCTLRQYSGPPAGFWQASKRIEPED